MNGIDQSTQTLLSNSMAYREEEGQWKTGNARKKRAGTPVEGEQRAIVGENPAGPFVYEHCLAYSVPMMAHAYIYTGNYVGDPWKAARGWHSFYASYERGEPKRSPVAVNTYRHSRISKDESCPPRFYLLYDRHPDNGGRITVTTQRPQFVEVSSRFTHMLRNRKEKGRVLLGEICLASIEQSRANGGLSSTHCLCYRYITVHGS